MLPYVLFLACALPAAIAGSTLMRGAMWIHPEWALALVLFFGLGAISLPIVAAVQTRAMRSEQRDAGT